MDKRLDWYIMMYQWVVSTIPRPAWPCPYTFSMVFNNTQLSIIYMNMDMTPCNWLQHSSQKQTALTQARTWSILNIFLKLIRGSFNPWRQLKCFIISLIVQVPDSCWSSYNHYLLMNNHYQLQLWLCSCSLLTSCPLIPSHVSFQF